MKLFEVDSGESEHYWEDDLETLKSLITDVKKAPYTLEAVHSNWRSQTGYTEAENVDELVSKIFSFGNTWVALHREGQQLYISTASHDVPTGFRINILVKR